MSLEEELLKVNPEEYGDEYNAHLLEQYKLYVELMDRVSVRRQAANTFFLSVNTALTTLTGLATHFAKECGLASVPFVWLLALPIAGIVLCFVWHQLVRSYKGLNTGKFRIIHTLEKRLPASLFKSEWDCLGRGDIPELYQPFSEIELKIPWVFGLLYCGLTVLVILNKSL